MDIEDMHQFIKHLNYAIVLLDLVKNKANSTTCSKRTSYNYDKPITKKHKGNKTNKVIRLNSSNSNKTKINITKQTSKTKHIKETYLFVQSKTSNRKSVEPKK